MVKPVYENETYEAVFELLADAVLGLQNQDYFYVANRLRTASEIARKAAVKSPKNSKQEGGRDE